MIKILLVAVGALLNRIRGGLFDFGGNKLLFPLFLALVNGQLKSGICVFIAAYVGQQFGWGTYIGALFGTLTTQPEVPQIDEIVNSLRVTLNKKTIYLSDYPRLWGFVALGLRGLMWSFFVGLAVHSMVVMICGILMPVCYLVAEGLDKFVFNKGGKTAWDLGEWIWGAVFTAVVIW